MKLSFIFLALLVWTQNVLPKDSIALVNPGQCSQYTGALCVSDPCDVAGYTYTIDACGVDTGSGVPWCCSNTDPAAAPPAGPPVPPPGGGGGGTPVPDTACPADTTYVALTDSCISVDAFNTFLFNLLIFAGVLVAIYRATAGFFLFLTADGSPEKLQGGREALTQAMVGLVIVVSGWVLIHAFESILPAMWGIFLTG